MKKISTLLTISFLITCMISFSGCKKDEAEIPGLTTPAISTTVVSGITATSAIIEGVVTKKGSSEVTSRGACWSTARNPTLTDNKTSGGLNSSPVFFSKLVGLMPNTIYYVRAFATNRAGTTYGNEIEFTTKPGNVIILTTTPVTEILASGAVSGGNITSDGGLPVTDWGVCWSTSENPTTNDNRCSFTGGTGGMGLYSFDLSGLSPQTTYFLRAYAINSAGTCYGNEISFTTAKAVLATLTTAEVSNITLASAISGGTITDNGGERLVAGVCWGTTANPTTGNNKSTLYSVNAGDFSSPVFGLQPSTKYYIRSYATNSAGTAYGNELSFTTSAISPINYNPDLTYGTVSDIDGNIYKTVRIGTQVWMAENLKTTRYRDGTSIPHVTGDAEWIYRSVGGYCWYNNDESTFKNTYGALYNWYAVTDSRKICPAGWHVPTAGEWNTLATYLGGETVAGGKAKETGTAHWVSPNGGATNESGFTGLPGGGRYYQADDNPENQFLNIGNMGSWWSTTSTDPGGQGADLFSTFANSSFGFDNEWQSWKINGLSVRCMKDN